STCAGTTGRSSPRRGSCSTPPSSASSTPPPVRRCSSKTPRPPTSRRRWSGCGGRQGSDDLVAPPGISGKVLLPHRFKWFGEPERCSACLAGQTEPLARTPFEHGVQVDSAIPCGRFGGQEVDVCAALQCLQPEGRCSMSNDPQDPQIPP